MATEKELFVFFLFFLSKSKPVDKSDERKWKSNEQNKSAFLQKKEKKIKCRTNPKSIRKFLFFFLFERIEIGKNHCNEKWI